MKLFLIELSSMFLVGAFVLAGGAIRLARLMAVIGSLGLGVALGLILLKGTAVSISEMPTTAPGSVKPWYSSKAWFVFAAGAIGVIVAEAFGARSVSITVTVTSLAWTSGVIALIGWGFLLAGYLRSRGYLLPRKEIQ